MSPATKDARVEAPDSIRSPISTVSSVGASSNGTHANFASPLVQTKINELSRSTQGQNTAQKAERVVSQFAGRFTLRAGQLSLPNVTFDVPGSAIRLAGHYELVSEQMDFAGTIFADASLSK